MKTTTKALVIKTSKELEIIQADSNKTGKVVLLRFKGDGKNLFLVSANKMQVATFYRNLCWTDGYGVEYPTRESVVEGMLARI